MIIDGSLVLAQDSTAELITGVLAAIQPVLEYLGTVAFAISGVFAADGATWTSAAQSSSER